MGAYPSLFSGSGCSSSRSGFASVETVAQNDELSAKLFTDPMSTDRSNLPGLLGSSQLVCSHGMRESQF